MKNKILKSSIWIPFLGVLLAVMYLFTIPKKYNNLIELKGNYNLVWVFFQMVTTAILLTYFDKMIF